MSDAEERASYDNVSDNDGLEDDQLQACGRSSPPNQSQTFDQSVLSTLDDGGDNFSIEVHLGGDNSRHASEISSISYQNLLEEGDTTSTSMLSRRGSEDSTDSYPPDFENDLPPDEMETFEASDLPLSEHYASWRMKQVPKRNNTDCEEEAREQLSRSPSKSVSPAVSGGDRRRERSRDGKRNSGGSDGTNSDASLSKKTLQSLTVSDPSAQDSSAVLRRKNVLHPGTNIGAKEETNGSKKRNSLEIRNNIPVVGEVKTYEGNNGACSQKPHSIKPKIKSLKQSPGLARRIHDQTGKRDGSSSERETEGCGEHSSCQSQSALEIKEHEAEKLSEAGKKEVLMPVRRNVDIENEYDYVKYARVQHGNSYVGMRLAYSSSNDSLSLKRNSLHSHGSNSIDSSREPSPEKVLHQKILNDLNGHVAQERVCEDSLTEIPLNSDSCQHEGRKAFTLSPEATECDSVEVESVTSDGENSTPGFPTVEDGLSSSQGSDAEDGPGFDSSSPSHQLRMKQKATIEQEMAKTEEEEEEEDEISKGPRDMDAQAIMNDLKAKREALDMAIADIKSAIQRSKQVALASPYDTHQQGEATEPVWIRRDNPQIERLDRQEEMRRVRDEIERQQEEKQQPRGDKVEDDSVSASVLDPDQERDLDPEDHDLESHDHGLEPQDTDPLREQYEEGERRPRGYDSDDECEESGGMRYTRRNKGKKYAPLRKDDSLEHGAAGKVQDRSGFGSNGASVSANGRAGSDANHVNNHTHNSQPRYSSEENASDAEPLSQGSYVRQQAGDSDTDEETDRLLQKQYQRRDQYVAIPELDNEASKQTAKAQHRQSKAKEENKVEQQSTRSSQVLIEGVLFRARYLGSTQLVSEGQPSKAMRMMQAQEAVGRIKAPEGESQPSTDVDLFVSTEKIMVLNTDLQEIMMDHALRTISYIADIGDILVIMARRRILTSPDETLLRRRRQAKILCHVFESEEAQLIAQSIGQAFQVAYLEFLKANGIEDPGLLREMDYQDVLNQQEIYGEELQLFANKDFHKEVIVPKMKGEPLGVVIVESGWGSMVPTVVLANMLPNGPAARCGQLNIGDQIISINGVSLVGLPLSACQTYIKAAKTQSVVKLTVVPCPPVVEVLIKRPDVKYQLGFSVQNGVICSLLRGGIAERGGVRVGHRIIEINNQSVVAVPHEKIVSLLATSVGEIHMKTMPTSIFRLLTGQDIPHYL
ncbi:uncharacterized protein LOC143297390 isoform X2 [Babylonia areolata]|uniref:uncharacterized protein LOC143297390 isoform X2 n=1 Tax=Babylonia areolata TaxID=304850 RepID=UPI003FD4845F